MRKYPKHILEPISGFLKKKKKKRGGGLPKAKLVLWNVQFPILCTYMYEPIFKSFYYLYYTAYMTEIDLFDAQYKDKDLSNIWPLTIRVCGRGSHVRGGRYSKMVNEEDQHQLWSLTFEKISKTYSGTYFRVFEKGFHKAKIVLWNVQFPILCT